MVHKVFDPLSIRFNQIGSGSYFIGLPYQRGYGQRGAGVGRIFGRLSRFLIPLAKHAGKKAGKKILKATGREALETGLNILENIAQGVNIKDAVVTESKKGIKRMAQRVTNRFDPQEGSGIRRRKRLKGKRVAKFRVTKRRRKDTFGFY